MMFLSFFKWMAFGLSALLLSACSGGIAVLESPKMVTPLDPSAEVSFVVGAEMPVIPENSRYIGTIETSAESGCTVASLLTVLENRAREVGANFVFIKTVGKVNVVRGYMVYTVHTCLSVVADLMYTENPVYSNISKDSKTDSGEGQK